MAISPTMKTRLSPKPRWASWMIFWTSKRTYPKRKSETQNPIPLAAVNRRTPQKYWAQKRQKKKTGLTIALDSVLICSSFVNFVINKKKNRCCLQIPYFFSKTFVYFGETPTRALLTTDYWEFRRGSKGSKVPYKEPIQRHAEKRKKGRQEGGLGTFDIGV